MSDRTRMPKEEFLKRTAEYIRVIASQLEPEERVEFFDSLHEGYCVGCGCDDPDESCHCMNET
jgi:hypothetical protein